MSYPQNEQFRENYHDAKEEAKRKKKAVAKKMTRGERNARGAEERAKTDLGLRSKADIMKNYKKYYK